MTAGQLEVLVVEDSDDDFYAFRRICRRLDLDLTVTRCRDAAEADATLEARAARPPRLVLLDLNLPGEDGRALLRRLKSTPTFAAVPVVVFSTSDDPADIAYCYANRANAYHVKPPEFRRMRDEVTMLLRYWLVGVRGPETA